MSVQLNNDGTLSLTAMSLVEFLPEIETAIHNGFKLNLEKNEGVPQQYGSMLVLTMYPAGKIEVQEVDKEESVHVASLSTESEQVPKENKPVEVAPIPAVRAVTPQPLKTAAQLNRDVELAKIDGRKKKV